MQAGVFEPGVCFCSFHDSPLSRASCEGTGTSEDGKNHVYEVLLLLAYNRAMNGITIYIDWAYFLGIVGTLIGIAYYANGRFTKIETTVEWLKEILLEIKERLEDGKRQPHHGRRRKE